MNPSIKKLGEIAKKDTKTIIGLMSGTSLDGLDIALCEIHGAGPNTEIELKEFVTKPYTTENKKRLSAISSINETSMEEVCLLHSWLGNYHGQLINEALRDWEIAPSEVDCIASHGQTIYHLPKIQHRQENMPNATLQIGDSDHIARTTGILTIGDFRQKHTAAGGEGAPMVSFVDRLLYTHDSEERILLNIGGIANFTYLPARNNSQTQTITTDTGPGNTLIDMATRQYFSADYDKDGAIAKRGTVNRKALNALKADPYFKKPLPKTTGPELFNLKWVDRLLFKAGVADIKPEDLISTLSKLTAETIAETIELVLEKEAKPAVYISGGGIHNPVVRNWIDELLPEYPIKSFGEIGFDPDAKEAVLFAILANETLSGKGFSLDANDPDSPTINFGKISLPS
ncbi:anhydro-N-acetylmuramic acid kinase [Fodinibius halophilus]|uniref:Anhydro-N-acetylmuramic acid kinase n=1 Tax=Fodinibius halophilus TaxID=1736908 RepID=A0A6M1T5X1_9BACT|nr:anhydro-N-acetylmuramic acid kinase [Fodinibius halophilus]NGP89517.1 anhydro-N-acetylmuramic acid kinase [Fodinibius halophilus]